MTLRASRVAAALALVAVSFAAGAGLGWLYDSLAEGFAAIDRLESEDL